VEQPEVVALPATAKQISPAIPPAADTIFFIFSDTGTLKS
jgi:hypothetical protein